LRTAAPGHVIRGLYLIFRTQDLFTTSFKFISPEKYNLFFGLSQWSRRFNACAVYGESMYDNWLWDRLVPSTAAFPISLRIIPHRIPVIWGWPVASGGRGWIQTWFNTETKVQKPNSTLILRTTFVVICLTAANILQSDRMSFYIFSEYETHK